MTSDELRALADAATPGPWRHEGHRTEGMLVSVSTGTIVIDPFFPNPQDLPLIETMGGPDAARLLADAMEYVNVVGAYLSSENASSAAVAQAEELLARFEKLGGQA